MTHVFFLYLRVMRLGVPQRPIVSLFEPNYKTNIWYPTRNTWLNIIIYISSFICTMIHVCIFQSPLPSECPNGYPHYFTRSPHCYTFQPVIWHSNPCSSDYGDVFWRGLRPKDCSYLTYTVCSAIDCPLWVLRIDVFVHDIMVTYHKFCLISL